MTKFWMVIAVAVWLTPYADARDWRAGTLVQAQYESDKKRSGPIQRGEGQQQPRDDKRGQNRLTQEERRELNRDLDRANREIYKRPPSR
jgi:hypothetical protein